MFGIDTIRETLSQGLREGIKTSGEDLLNTSTEVLHKEVEPYLERLDRMANLIEKLIQVLEPISILLEKLPFVKNERSKHNQD
jgi:tetrahydromethanopterin S-methyltransferase subunit B